MKAVEESKETLVTKTLRKIKESQENTLDHVLTLARIVELVVRENEELKEKIASSTGEVKTFDIPKETTSSSEPKPE